MKHTIKYLDFAIDPIVENIIASTSKGKQLIILSNFINNNITYKVIKNVEPTEVWIYKDLREAIRLYNSIDL